MVEFIAVNFAHCKGETVWITDLLTPEATGVFKSYRTYLESYSYRFKEDLKLVWPLSESGQLRNDSYPGIVSAAMSGKIAIETFCLLDKVYDGAVLRGFDAQITERYLWPRFSMRARKFVPFLHKCESNILKNMIDSISGTK